MTIAIDLFELFSSSELFSFKGEMDDFLRSDFSRHNLFFKDPKMLSPAGCHFDLLLFLKRASLVLAASLIENNPPLALKVRSALTASLNFLGKDFCMPSALLTEPFPYFTDEAKFLYLTLIKALYRIFDDSAFLSVIDAGRFEEGDLTISPFCEKITSFFNAYPLPRWENREIYLPPIPNLQNRSDDEVTFILNTFGFGASMGTLCMNGVEVRAFGPEFAPLAEGRTFGCFRMDGAIEEDKGWTRLADPLADIPRAGGDFLHLEGIKREESIELKIKVVKTSAESCFFTFFIAADQLVLASGLEVKRGALCSYEGPIEEISLYKAKERVILKASFKGHLKVIPLEGKRHFWGADYLVAFEIGDNMAGYKWMFIK